MDRDTAVRRIQDGLDGLSNIGGRLSDKIVLRLQEAQRDLEKGKTLPKFLLQEQQTLPLVLGASTAALPAGFLRIDDSIPPYYIANVGDDPTYIAVKRDFGEAFRANFDSEAMGPKVMFIRNAVVDFINTADATYSIVWNYFKAAQILTTNIENEWLANAPEWLIGEAGYRIAKDARDKDAVMVFDGLRIQGRAAIFGEIIASEEASGPIMMGANL